MPATISEDEFLNALRTFRRSAFRLETRDSYALGYEAVDFARFLAGSPVPPPELDWWRPWLDRVTRFTREGKMVSRVRILAEPPTDYQRWQLWAAPWHIAAGEDIRYMTRGAAEGIGLPLPHDWWLLDDQRVIVMRFTDDGEIESKSLITDPVPVASYRLWRDVAIRHATPARNVAAA